ncbi:DUF4177 domain-containing protein [Rhodobacteraceae bacterium D3-12]|nr:DUF4177 domain-containing protein [Rhodobacteraceae bacterium D3-12]
MTLYEYKVVPAPRKGVKSKGLKTNEARFSFAIQELMNEHGAEGWEYQRAETLPCDERQGLTGSHTVYRDMLVFRRPRAQAQETVHQETIEDTPAPDPTPATDSLYDTDTPHDAADGTTTDTGVTDDAAPYDSAAYEPDHSDQTADATGGSGDDSLPRDPYRPS